MTQPPEALPERWAHPAVDAGLILLACIVLPTLTARAMPGVLPESTCITLAIGVSLAVAALSANLLLGYAGQLSLGHGAILGTGAFAASLVVDRAGLPMSVGFVAAILAGAAIALVIGVPALRLRGLYLALVTMVFGLTMQASVLRWQVFTHGSAGALLPRRIWGDRLLNDAPAYLAVCLVLLVGVWWLDRNLTRSRLGRAFAAIKEDEVAAASFGIDVTLTKLTAFVISGAMAGLAGAMYGHSLGLVNSDTFSRELSLRIVLFVVIGGAGRRWGVALIAVLLSLSPKLPEVFSGYDLILAAAVVLYNLVRLPAGLAGLVAERRAHRLAKEQEALDEDEDEPVVPDLAAVAMVVAGRAAAGPSTAGAAGAPAGGSHQGGDQTVPVLEITHISVAFGGLRAVEDVSLSVPEGLIVGLIGPNGAGKSTLFGAISGAVAANRGRVRLDGHPIEHLPAHARAAAGIGRTFQLVGLAKDQTVRDNILLAQHLAAGYSISDALLRTGRARRVEADLVEVADAVIAGLGFERFADVTVRSLSGGQQRIVEVAAVLATRPRLLMLDEPTAGLSPAASENLAVRLAQLRDDLGQTVLLIEHNVPLVLDVCDHIHVLTAGQLLASGRPEELARDERVLSAYLGTQA